MFVLLLVPLWFLYFLFFFFFNDPATTEIYTLSLHDALPICMKVIPDHTLDDCPPLDILVVPGGWGTRATRMRSEEHTSELQSHSDLVCRLLLEKKKKKKKQKKALKERA